MYIYDESMNETWQVSRNERGDIVAVRTSDNLTEIPLLDPTTNRLVYSFPEEVPNTVKRACNRLLMM